MQEKMAFFFSGQSERGINTKSGRSSTEGITYGEPDITKQTGNLGDSMAGQGSKGKRILTGMKRSSRANS